MIFKTYLNVWFLQIPRKGFISHQSFELFQKYAKAMKIRVVIFRIVFDLSLMESWFISIIRVKRITPCPRARQESSPVFNVSRN